MLALLSANALLHHARIDGRPLPDYAAWSGVLQLERKLRLLEEFAREGPVDVLLISSSMGDHGISASTLGERTRELGRPLRVFNFSLGGADLPTYPAMYRLARMVARPRQAWLVAPMGGPQDRVVPGSLDEQLLEGPAGRFRHPGLLEASWHAYNLSLVRFAPAIRDFLLAGAFPGRPATSLDFYGLDAAGDTISWVYNASRYEVGRKLVEDRKREARRFLDGSPAARQGVEREYFNGRTLAGIRELRRLLAEDSVPLTVIAFDHAVGLRILDADYFDGTRRYFERLASELGATLLDVRPDFAAMPHMFADPSHLNSHGARAFSELLAARVAGAPTPRYARSDAPRSIEAQLDDTTWTPFTALVRKSAREGSGTLYLRYLDGWGVERLRAGARMEVAIRPPDDNEVIVPARVLEDGEVACDTSGLPIDGRDVVLRVQLAAPPGNREPLPLPLSAYRWSASRQEMQADTTPALGFVAPLARAYSVVDPIGVHWHSVRDPQRGDWIGVFPAGDRAAPRLTYAVLEGRAEGEAAMRPLYQPGRYELRLMSANGWNVLAVSDPFEVVPITGTVRASREMAHPGSDIHVQWAALSSADRNDWVGLYAEGEMREPLVYDGTRGRPSGGTWLTIPDNPPLERTRSASTREAGSSHARRFG